MRIRSRIGARLSHIGAPLLAAWALSLAAPAVPRASDSPAPADAASLALEIRPVLAHAYPGIDTAALLARIQERLKWGERDEDLIEAEGILHWDRGETNLAIPCFKQLSAPRAPAMAMMARALESRGERYEAADWYLRAARSLPVPDPEAVAAYRRALAIRPADARAELELAIRLEAQMAFGEALDLYWKHRSALARDTAAAGRVADLLAAHGRLADAAALADSLRRAQPFDPASTARLARIREALAGKASAAEVWIEAWKTAPGDTVSFRNAMTLLRASGPSGDVRLKSLLQDALAIFPDGADLHYHMALLLLRGQDRKGAYPHLDRALSLAPGHPEYLERLPDAIEGDSLIRAHAAMLAARSGEEPYSARLALLAARAHSLDGDRARACAAWSRAAAADPKALDGRRDAFLDLAACGDPASVALASAIGERQMAAGFDREAARVLIPIALEARDFPKAAGYAARLAAESPADASRALDAARALLAAGKDAEAGTVLTAIADHAGLAEAGLLLGRLHMAARAWGPAAERLKAVRDSLPEARRLLGECLAESKEYAAAAVEYRAHYAAAGDKSSLHAAARLYRLAEDPGGESAALRLLADSGWADEGERLRLGLAKAGKGDTRGAKALFSVLFRSRASLPADDADWAEAALIYGIQAARDGELDAAIQVLTLGLKSAPAGMAGLAEPWLRLGECRAEKKQWREAHAAYASALAADPQSYEAAVEMLNAAKRFEGREEIAAAYRAVYRLDSLNVEANAALGAECQAARDYRQAARHFRRVAQARPGDAQAWESLGNALAMIPDLKAAGAALQTALDLGAQSDEVFINRARAYRAEGERRMAASIIAFLMGRNPRNYLAVLWSAKFAEEDGYSETAGDLYRKTARLQAPRSPWPGLAEAGAGARESKTAARAE